MGEIPEPDERNVEIELVLVETPEQIEHIRTLFREYYDWVQDFTGISLNFQSHQAELAGLPGYYGPPEGCLVLVMDAEQPAGCAALRPLEPGVCEIKRMFIRPEYQGRGLGRLLGKRIIFEARHLGYSLVRLDTADVLTPAQRLYESLGFRRSQPYYSPPPEIAHRILFYEMPLK